MKKVIILAGNGDLPYLIASSLKKEKIEFSIIAFENNKTTNKLNKFSPKQINFGKIVTELKKLKKKIIMN